MHRRHYVERLFLLPDDEVPEELAIKVGRYMPQVGGHLLLFCLIPLHSKVMRSAKQLNEYTQEEMDAVPRIVPPVPLSNIDI